MKSHKIVWKEVSKRDGKSLAKGKEACSRTQRAPAATELFLKEKVGWGLREDCSPGSPLWRGWAAFGAASENLGRAFLGLPGLFERH